MNYNSIKKLQKIYGYYDIQNMINDGSIWKMESSISKNAMNYIEKGICMLSLESASDLYGNKVPSRNELEKGTKGTYQFSLNFWEKVESNEIFLN